MPDLLLPDIESLLTEFFVGHPMINSIVADRVGTSVDATLPAIRLTRLGRAQNQPWEDAPEVQIDCWANDSVAASLLARTVIAVLPDVIGFDYSQGGGARSCEVTMGPLWAPDPDTNEARYIVDAVLLTYPS